MGKPYSDKRWSMVPDVVFSACNSCRYHLGAGKCEKHPEGIPDEKMNSSFPGSEGYKKKYCKYRAE